MRVSSLKKIVVSTWAACTVGGGAIGTALGIYTAKNSFDDKLVRPLLGFSLGVLGGMITPIGCYWLYEIVKNRRDFI